MVPVYEPVASSEKRQSRREHHEGCRHGLFKIIFEADTPAGAAFDIILLIAILISVLAVVLESVPQYRHHYGTIFKVAEYTFTSAFTIEYLLRLAVSPSPSSYFLSFFGIVDLASILPTFIDLVVRPVLSIA